MADTPDTPDDGKKKKKKGKKGPPLGIIALGVFGFLILLSCCGGCGGCNGLYYPTYPYRTIYSPAAAYSYGPYYGSQMPAGYGANYFQNNYGYNLRDGMRVGMIGTQWYEFDRFGNRGNPIGEFIKAGEILRRDEAQSIRQNESFNNRGYGNQNGYQRQFNQNGYQRPPMQRNNYAPQRRQPRTARYNQFVPQQSQRYQHF